MIRDAKLYILEDKDWKPLAELINNHNNYRMKNDITIFQFPSQDSKGDYYSILSLSEKADLIIEEYGGYHSPINTLYASLPNYIGEPLFGDKSNTAFLPKM